MGIGSANCACPSTRLVGLIAFDSIHNGWARLTTLSQA